jgi:hypothetical protein
MTNYYAKYIKYKEKYIKLKKQIGGIIDNTLPVGINFESGKIITWETKCDNCIGWANCQIGMDAPYHGRVADATHRNNGRSEKFFSGYREDLLLENLRMIFQYIKDNYSDTLVVIQIARGKSAYETVCDIIRPLLENIGIDKKNYIIKYGYRKEDYFVCDDLEVPFVFVNIGMFAVLSNVEEVYVGQLCNPVITWNITNYNGETKEFAIEDTLYDFSTDIKNILNHFESIKKIKLFGIADKMKFVTPDIYHKDAIDKLVEKANS